MNDLDASVLPPNLTEMLSERPSSDQRKLTLLALKDQYVSFATESLMLVCGDAPAEWWGQPDARMFAKTFGASSQSGESVDFVLAFPCASTALRAAVLWQRMSTRRLPRLSLLSARCTVATFETESGSSRYVLGPAVKRCSQLALQAAAGAIALPPETFLVLREQIARDVSDALVVTEMDGDEITHVSVLLAPETGAELSTFAGLGLT